MKFGLTKIDNNFRSELDNFGKSIGSLFDDFFNFEPVSIFKGNWAPSVDIEEDAKSISIKADIPGIDEKNLNVNLENNVLTISGERNEEKKSEIDDKKYIVSERSYGSFCRSIALPEGIKSDEIKAEFKNGVLNINIPKEKVEEPKKIKINVN